MSIFDRLAGGPGNLQAQDYDNWNQMVGSAPPEHFGAASGISETGAELGGALGISILGSIGTAVYRGTMADAIPAAVPVPVAEAIRSTLGGALAEAGRLPDAIRDGLLGTARQAFVESMQLAALVCAAIAIGTAVMVVILLRRVRTASERAAMQVEPALSP